MRVREYLTFRARLEGVPSTGVRQRVGEAIDRCLLQEVADRRIENLSKGFRQRTSLAGALVHQPPVLILDEPTVGLDPMQIIKIRETIRELGKNRAVLLSTHILPEVDAVCDRILVIARGRIVAEGTTAQLRQKFSQHPVFRAAFRGSVAAREALAALPGVISVVESASETETSVRLECALDADPAEAVFQAAVSRGWVLRELRRDVPSLEEVFVRLTQHQELPADASSSDSASVEASSSAKASEDKPADEPATTGVDA
jgi:ABC-2 type transport system ATP-binding protein